MCANAIIWRKSMNFDDFDETMRIFETVHDVCVLPGIHMVARIDGRNFSRLTKETCAFKAPFDERFRDCMAETVRPSHVLRFQRHLRLHGKATRYRCFLIWTNRLSAVSTASDNPFSRPRRQQNAACCWAYTPPLTAASANCQPGGRCWIISAGVPGTPCATP